MAFLGRFVKLVEGASRRDEYTALLSGCSTGSDFGKKEMGIPRSKYANKESGHGPFEFCQNGWRENLRRDRNRRRSAGSIEE
jgi:hypothetical protein